MSSEMGAKTKVSIVRCGDYSQEKVDKAVERSVLLLGGIKRFVKKGDRVLLKVNLLIGKDPKYAVTTHPAIVRAVVRLVRKAGGVASVGDSPSASSFNSFSRAAGLSGFKGVCDELGVPLVELDDPVETKVEGVVVKSFAISKKLNDFGVMINLPKLKTHSLTMFTGAAKNLYSCVSGRRKAVYHTIAVDGMRFSELILDLNEVVKPQLNVMDGIIGMEGNGPAAGSPKKVGVVIAGDNAIAVDAVAAEIVGMGREVPLINIAKARKMHGADLKQIRIIGDKIEEVRIDDFRKPGTPIFALIPEKAKKVVRVMLDQKPVVDKKVCIGCKSCGDVCPKKAITMVGKRPSFDYRKCIRCFCCMEVCPVKAIGIWESPASKVIRRILK